LAVSVRAIPAIDRWGSLISGAAVIAVGLSRRTVAGACLATAAVPLTYRGLVGEWPWLRNGRRAQSKRPATVGTLVVSESIRLERPVPEVFRFWRNLENLPRFMTRLERVTEFAGGRSHWVARGPAGMKVEWDAEIVLEVENELIAWRATPESGVAMAGSVTFSAARRGRSAQVSVRLQYAPPIGRVSVFIATIAGANPAWTVREDLRRVKQILEAGEIPRAVAGRRRPRAR
jgi:uncharacterized membrane protein